MSYQQNQSSPLNATVPRDLAGRRLDQVLGLIFEDYSRTRLQEWVRLGRVWVDGQPCRIRQRMNGGEKLRVEPLLDNHESWQPEALELNICYEDQHLLVLNKPPGLVVHPGAGNPNGTLLNALLHHKPGLATLPRAGIVHRLDKNTSGLMVVACSLECQTHLSRMIAAHRITREYEALVHGHPPLEGRVDQPIGRHQRQRTRMAVSDETRGKPAQTCFRRLAQFTAHSHLSLRLETGRTHQIRVHMCHIGHPLVGDPQYTGYRPAPGTVGAPCRNLLESFGRQALHARRLAFRHPVLDTRLEFKQAAPADIQQLLQALADDCAAT